MRQLGERKRRRCERILGMPIRRASVASRGNRVLCEVDIPPIVVNQMFHHALDETRVYRLVAVIDPKMTRVVSPPKMELVAFRQSQQEQDGGVICADAEVREAVLRELNAKRIRDYLTPD